MFRSYTMFNSQRMWCEEHSHWHWAIYKNVTLALTIGIHLNAIQSGLYTSAGYTDWPLYLDWVYRVASIPRLGIQSGLYTSTGYTEWPLYLGWVYRVASIPRLGIQSGLYTSAGYTEWPLYLGWVYRLATIPRLRIWCTYTHRTPDVTPVLIALHLNVKQILPEISLIKMASETKMSIWCNGAGADVLSLIIIQ